MTEFEDKAICFVSFISRDDKPLYIQSFDLTDDIASTNNFLKYNFLSHIALDIITSPASVSIREQQQGIDIQNGAVLLVVQDDVTVYGYESNTGLKIIIGFNDQTRLKREDSAVKTSLRNLFLSIHKVYIKTICNPFLDVDESDTDLLQTDKFNKSIGSIVSGYNDV